jgi:hypothetical protein
MISVNLSRRAVGLWFESDAIQRFADHRASQPERVGSHFLCRGILHKKMRMPKKSSVINALK